MDLSWVWNLKSKRSCLSEHIKCDLMNQWIKHVYDDNTREGSVNFTNISEINGSNRDRSQGQNTITIPIKLNIHFRSPDVYEPTNHWLYVVSVVLELN